MNEVDEIRARHKRLDGQFRMMPWEDAQALFDEIDHLRELLCQVIDNPQVVYSSIWLHEAQWVSPCSAHQVPDLDCPRCTAGGHRSLDIGSDTPETTWVGTGDRYGDDRYDIKPQQSGRSDG